MKHFRSSLLPHPQNVISAFGSTASYVYTNGNVSVLKFCSSIVSNNSIPYNIENTFSYDFNLFSTLLYFKPGVGYTSRIGMAQSNAYCEKESTFFKPPFTYNKTTTTCSTYDPCVDCKVSLFWKYIYLF